jgi:hypothetical protein
VQPFDRWIRSPTFLVKTNIVQTPSTSMKAFSL